MKRRIPLILALGIITGCAAQDAIKTLQSAFDRGALIVRSITFDNQPHVFVAWGRTSAAKLQSITRYEGSLGTPLDVSKYSSEPSAVGVLEDNASPSVQPDVTYSYRIRFENTNEVDRQITPIGVGSFAGQTVQMLSPENPNPLNPTVINEAKPTFRFTKIANSNPDRKVSYLVSVAQLATGSVSFAPAENAVVYAAIIDPDKHSADNVVSVPMGTDTDVPIPSELLNAMSGPMAALKPVDGSETKSLTNECIYGWTVAPLIYNSDLTTFAIGNMATPFFFKYQQ